MDSVCFLFFVLFHSFTQEVDIALLKLYAEFSPEKLADLISADNGCDLTDCADWLERHGRLHAQALLYQRHGECEKALSVWKM